MNRDQVVSTDKHGMEYLTGAWVSDATTQEKWAPAAYLFLDGLMIRLDFARDDAGQRYTLPTIYGYVVNEDELEFADVSDKERVTLSAKWWVDEDGKLYLDKGEFTYAYDKTDVSGLVSQGFDLGLIDAALEGAKKGGFTFIEHPGAGSE